MSWAVYSVFCSYFNSNSQPLFVCLFGSVFTTVFEVWSGNNDQNVLQNRYVTDFWSLRGRCGTGYAVAARNAVRAMQRHSRQEIRYDDSER